MPYNYYICIKNINYNSQRIKTLKNLHQKGNKLMKLKMYNIINIYTTIKALIENENFNDCILKFKMLGILKSLESPISNYQVIQYDTIKELGTPVFNDNGKETGNYTISPDNKETVEKYIQTMNKLGETEIDIPLDKFKASVIFNKGITAEQLIHLYPIIEED